MFAKCFEIPGDKCHASVNETDYYSTWANNYWSTN